MTLTAAVASHLNLAEKMIIEVQEWASVLWVRICTGSPRFVSKKIKQMQLTNLSKKEIQQELKILVHFIDKAQYYNIKKDERNGFSRYQEIKESPEYQKLLKVLGMRPPLLDWDAVWKRLTDLAGSEKKRPWVLYHDFVLQGKRVEGKPLPISTKNNLSSLGKKIAGLSRQGILKDWELSYWDKNGECRLYCKDISYTNPKDRGFIVLHEDGSYSTHFQSAIQNNPFPDISSLLEKTVNDLVPQPKKSAEQLAIESLNRQFGRGGWSQLDLDDELESERYRGM